MSAPTSEDFRSRKASITVREAEAALRQSGYEFSYYDGKRANWVNGEGLRFQFTANERIIDPRAAVQIADLMEKVEHRQTPQPADAPTVSARKNEIDLPNGYGEKFGAYELDNKITLYEKQLPYIAQSFPYDIGGGQDTKNNQLRGYAIAFEQLSNPLKSLMEEVKNKYHVQISDEKGFVRLSQPDLNIEIGVSKEEPQFIMKLMETLMDVNRRAGDIATDRYGVLAALDDQKIPYVVVPVANLETAKNARISKLESPTAIPYYGADVIPQQAFDDLKELMGRGEKITLTKLPPAALPVKDFVDGVYEVTSEVPKAAQPGNNSSTPDILVSEPKNPVSPAPAEIKSGGQESGAGVKPDAAVSAGADDQGQNPLSPPRKNPWVLPNLPVSRPRHPMLLAPGETKNGKKDAKADIILDATALIVLSARANEEGQSLLGLLQHIANLPTVNSIVIPSTVADWELRGVVSDGKGLVDLDSAFYQRKSEKNNTNFAELNYILSNATRLCIDKDGRQQKIPGMLGNIVIFDSHEQRQALAPLVKIHEETKPGDNERRAKIIAFQQKTSDDLGGRHLGEDGVEEYLRTGIRKGIDAYVVSDDGEVRRGLEEAIGKRVLGSGQTQHGGRVNVLNTTALIASLGNDDFSVAPYEAMVAEASSTPKKIVQLIRENSDDVGRLSLSRPFEFNGRDYMGKSERLGRVLSEGVALTMGMDTDVPVSVRTATGILEKGKHYVPVNSAAMGAVIPPDEESPSRPAVTPVEPKTPAEPNGSPPPEVASGIAEPTPPATIPPASAEPAVQEKTSPVVEPIAPVLNGAVREAPAANELPAPVPDSPPVIQEILNKKRGTMTPLDEESFGWQIKIRRIDRGWSEPQLVKAVNKLLDQPQAEITIDHVFDWSQGLAVPNGAEFKALSQVLIHENPGVANKAKAFEDFERAYQNTANELRKSPDKQDRRTILAFSRQIFNLRNISGGGISENDLVIHLNSKLKTELPTVEEREQLEKDPYFIARIEHGAVAPSAGLMTLIVRAMDEISLREGANPRHLKEEEKTAIFDAYEDIASKPRTRPTSENSDQYTPELRALQGKIHELFRTPDGKVLSQADIMKILNERKGEDGNEFYTSMVGNLIPGAGRPKLLLPKFTDTRLVNALEAYLKDSGKPEEAKAVVELANEYYDKVKLRREELNRVER